MNKIQIIPEKIAQYLLFFVLFILPLGFMGYSIALVFLGFVVFFSQNTSANFRENIKSNYKNYVLFNGIFFLLIATYVFLSPNKHFAFFSVQEKLALIVIPVFFAAFNSNFLVQNKKKLLYVFTAGVFLATLMSYFHALNNSLQIDPNTGAYYLKLSPYSDMADKNFFQLIKDRTGYFTYGFLSYRMHVSYFALYISFAIAFIWKEITFFYRNKNYLKIALLSLLAIYFSFFIVLLQSRAGIIGLSILVGLFLLESFWKLKKLRKTIIVISGLMVVAFAYLFFNSLLYKNLQELEHKTNKVDNRVLIWDASIKLIKQNPIIGYGTGAQKKVVKTKMNQLYPQLKTAFRNQYDDPHNQFLAFWIENGILGLLFFIFWFYFLFRKAIKNKDNLLFQLTVLVFINVLFESMFERSFGLVFIMLFSSILLLSPPKSPLVD